MTTQYITLHVVRRALQAALQVGIWKRACALSTPQPGVNRTGRMPVEAHKQPGPSLHANAK